MSRTLLLLALVVLACGPHGDEAKAQGARRFTADADHAAPGERQPSAGLARAVVGALPREGRVEAVDACLAAHDLQPGDYAQLLRAVEISAGPDRRLFLVRGALEPRCSEAFFGQHDFRYAIVEETSTGGQPTFRTLLADAADRLTVLTTRRHGRNDIEAASCQADGCASERMAFDGRRYRTIACYRTAWDDRDREHRRAVRCRR